MKPAVAVTTILLALSLAGCGGEDKPAVCSSANDLKKSVEDVKKIDVESGDALADLKSALKTIESDLTAVKKDAKSEFSDQVDAVVSGFAALKSSVQTAAASKSADTLATAGAAISAFGTSVKTLVNDVQETC